MDSPNSPTLRLLIDRLGVQALTVVSAPRGLDVQLGQVVLYDPAQPASVSADDLVLGIGLKDDSALNSALRELSAAGAAGLFVKMDHVTDLVQPQSRRAASCAVIAIPANVSWLEWALLVRGVLLQLDNQPKVQNSLDDDLFSVANALAAAAGGPVLVEDEHHRHIAYSEHSRNVDPLRIATILLRRTPEDLTPIHNDQHYAKLSARNEPVYFDDLGPGQNRLAMTIRVDGQIVGWAWAVAPQPPTAATLEAFSRATHESAIYVLRRRIELDQSRRTRAEMVRSLLEGRADAQLTADRLDLGSRAYRVMACTTRTIAGAGIAQQTRFWDLLSMHTQLLPGAVPSALRDGVVHLILPSAPTSNGERDHTKSVGNRLVTALSKSHPDSIIGIGRLVERVVDLPRSCRDADRVLQSLRAFPRLPTVADISDVQLYAFLLDGLSVPADELELTTGPLATLATLDQEHGSTYLPTLIAYLDAFGDVAAAAASLGIHHNTLRYRVKRLQKLAGLNLDDPDQRLAVMFELRHRSLLTG